MNALQVVRNRRPYRDELPVAWDGHRVEWSECALPIRGFSHIGGAPCDGCGQTDGGIDSHMGTVWPLPDETSIQKVSRRTRSGRTYTREEERPALPLKRLYLTRCLECGLDQVYDIETDELWELDPTDYSDEGSWVRAPELPLEPTTRSQP